MKKLFLVLLVLLAVNVSVFSQENNDSKVKKVNSAKPTKEDLLLASFKEAGLTDEQVTKVVAIVEESAKKKVALRKDSSLDEQAKAKKNKELTNEMKNDLKGLMGEDTYKKWAVIRKNQSKTK